jgi:predicted nucleic acid-binding protein
VNYLLDTNVISELVRKEPNPGVVRWIDGCDESILFLSVLTLGEIQKGISKLNDKLKAERLQTWVEQELKDRFEGRILSINHEVASLWGKIQGTSEQSGVRLPVVDSLIAATAIVHNLTVVTRNVHDLERCQAWVYNPWEE